MARKSSLSSRLALVKNISTAQVTTRGRKSGKPHTVTTWFLVDGEAVYLATMKMNRDWTRNIVKNGHVELTIDGTTFTGRGTRITAPDRLARVDELLQQKYWAAWLGSWFGFAPEGAFAVALEG